MTTYKGMIMPPLIDTYEKDLNKVGYSFTNLYPKDGEKDYIVQSASVPSFETLYGDRNYVTNKASIKSFNIPHASRIVRVRTGEFTNDYFTVKTEEPDMPRQYPIEISWKKRINR